MLDYEYIKNHYRLIAVDLSSQKELHADPKAIQEIKFAGQLKNENSINYDGTQSMFYFNSFRKNQWNEIKISQRSVTVL